MLNDTPARLSRHAARFAAAFALVALLGWVAYQWVTWPDVRRLAGENPETTAFIERYREETANGGQPSSPHWTWVRDSEISVHMKRAAVAGEDLEFFSHRGFSSHEMRQAFNRALSGRGVRGASTITQQLAKNLWLTSSRSPWRKLKEAILTRQLERHLTKARILELYLNVVELGPGMYGVEAASRHYFGKPAAHLTAREAAMLAASLPRPAEWHPGSSSPAYAEYVTTIEERMERATFLWRHVTGPEGGGSPAQSLTPPPRPVPDLRPPGVW